MSLFQEKDASVSMCDTLTSGRGGQRVPARTYAAARILRPELAAVACGPLRGRGKT